MDKVYFLRSTDRAYQGYYPTLGRAEMAGEMSGSLYVIQPIELL